MVGTLVIFAKLESSVETPIFLLIGMSFLGLHFQNYFLPVY